MNRYPDIGDHGLIGDLQTAALVSTDGTIDWFCCPRFDSPSVFASLLDHDRGGHFRIGPDRGDYVSRQLYFPDTAILITRFLSPDGVGEVVDFMPVAEGSATDRHRLVRLMRVVRGTMRFRAEIQPRFDYGRKPHKLELHDDAGSLFRSDDLTLTLHRADLPGRSLHEEGTSLERDGDGLRLTKTMREGEIARVVMDSAGDPPKAVNPQELVELFNDTVRFWRGWLSRSTYNGRWKEQVARSAMTLKLMTYAPSGGLVAAPTAALEEVVLDHLEGYRGSRPVRIGNGAADQLQLDIYGEPMDSIYLADTHGLQVGHEGWTELADMLNWLCENWDQPEEGIWETRGGRQQFTYGRLMSWVALDRAVRLAQHRGRPADLSRWITERDRIYKEILERGWNPKREAFIQNYSNDVLDASLLLMPLMGFVAPSDPMWLSTLRAMDKELVSDSLVYRYDPNASPDGLRGTEGTFSICTFWYVDALARSGRLEDARLTLEKMSTYANHLGLYSEEIGLTGEQLGNFPQAFSHLAHINATLNLDFQLDHGPGWVEPVLSAGRRES